MHERENFRGSAHVRNLVRVRDLPHYGFVLDFLRARHITPRRYCFTCFCTSQTWWGAHHRWTLNLDGESACFCIGLATRAPALPDARGHYAANHLAKARLRWVWRRKTSAPLRQVPTWVVIEWKQGEYTRHTPSRWCLARFCTSLKLWGDTTDGHRLFVRFRR